MGLIAHVKYTLRLHVMSLKWMHDCLVPRCIPNKEFWLAEEQMEHGSVQELTAHSQCFAVLICSG